MDKAEMDSMNLESFEVQLRDEFNRLHHLEEQVIDLMRLMQDDVGVDSVDPRMRREICRMLTRLASFHRQIQAAIASSWEMIDLLEPSPPGQPPPDPRRRGLSGDDED